MDSLIPPRLPLVWGHPSLLAVRVGVVGTRAPAHKNSGLLKGGQCAWAEQAQEAGTHTEEGEGEWRLLVNTLL